eukprot:m.53415 g.53415  ORF g.53415 m.53415 type:complete len:524 (+) comp21758_c0_seq1:332-1903(+)
MAPSNLTKSINIDEESEDKSEASESQPLLSQQDQESPRNLSPCRDLIDTLGLASTLFIGSVSWVAMKTTDSAVLGHLGTEYLSAFALSDLWTSSSGVFVMGRVLSVLCGQALGSGNKMLAGKWMQVSLFVLSLVAVPIIALWLVTYFVLNDGFKQDHTLSVHASYYAMVLSTAMPARILSSQINQFFMAQRIMRPIVVCSSIAMVVNVIGALVFVLGIPFNPSGKQIGITLKGKASQWHGFGYLACPIVTVVVEYVQLAILLSVYCGCKGLHKPCWPGWSWSHITKARVWIFVKLYFPAALSLASDFWRVAVIGIFATRIQDDGVSLAVFNTAYRLCWISMIFVGSVSGAMSIKLSRSISKGDIRASRLTIVMSSLIVISIMMVLGTVVILFAKDIAMIFSSDEKVLDAFHTSRFTLTLMIIGMNFAVFLEKIPLALGRVNTVLWLGVMGSWAGQVPCVALATYFWQDSLAAIFGGVSIGYGILCVSFCIAIGILDWKKCVAEAQRRSEVTPITTTKESSKES